MHLIIQNESIKECLIESEESILLGEHARLLKAATTFSEFWKIVFKHALFLQIPTLTVTLNTMNCYFWLCPKPYGEDMFMKAAEKLSQISKENDVAGQIIIREGGKKYLLQEEQTIAVFKELGRKAAQVEIEFVSGSAEYTCLAFNSARNLTAAVTEFDNPSFPDTIVMTGLLTNGTIVNIRKDQLHLLTQDMLKGFITMHFPGSTNEDLRKIQHEWRKKILEWKSIEEKSTQKQKAPSN